MSQTLKVALIGANGQLGSDINSHFSQCDRYQLTALTRSDIDIRHADIVDQVLNRQKFDVVINSAAYVRVDDCEQEVDTAFNVNAIGALNVARTCRDIGAHCVYISTDYVFHGDHPHPYTEADIPNPINIYGTSKLTGEYLVQQTTARSLIVRISSVFGKAGASGKGGNFVETMIKKAKVGDPIKVVNDILMSPTYTYDAARLLDVLLQEGATGLIHGANSGSCSWHEFASAIMRIKGFPIEVQPIDSATFAAKAKRPSFSALGTRWAQAAGFPYLSPWEEALKDYLQIPPN